jgi:hypothetical protein
MANLTLIKKLVRLGNSKGFIIDSSIVKSEKFILDKTYKLTIEEI